MCREQLHVNSMHLSHLTDAQTEDRAIASRDDNIKRLLAAFGQDESTTNHALAIDAVLQSWRRRAQKRELGQMALSELGLDLDLPKLDVIVAIRAPSNEFGPQDQDETMVATIAARLGIDPSRASRLVSELITEGYVERAVSQQDARRTIVTLTPRGVAVVEAVRTIKFLILDDFLSDWTDEEIRTFIPLLDRFSNWADAAGTSAPDKFRQPITELRAMLKRDHGL